MSQSPNPCHLEACQGQPICAQCQSMQASAPPESAPAFSAAQLAQAILQIEQALPSSTRMHTTGSIIILTLGHQIPSEPDAQSAIGFIRAMRATDKAAA